MLIKKILGTLQDMGTAVALAVLVLWSRRRGGGQH